MTTAVQLGLFELPRAAGPTPCDVFVVDGKGSLGGHPCHQQAVSRWVGPEGQHRGYFCNAHAEYYRSYVPRWEREGWPAGRLEVVV